MLLMVDDALKLELVILFYEACKIILLTAGQNKCLLRFRQSHVFLVYQVSYS